MHPAACLPVLSRQWWWLINHWGLVRPFVLQAFAPFWSVQKRTWRTIHLRSCSSGKWHHYWIWLVRIINSTWLHWLPSSRLPATNNLKVVCYNLCFHIRYVYRYMFLNNTNKLLFATTEFLDHVKFKLPVPVSVYLLMWT